ncbi:hypothetical protein ACN38_g11999, partial [Penicillium nordicum]
SPHLCFSSLNALFLSKDLARNRSLQTKKQRKQSSFPNRLSRHAQLGIVALHQTKEDKNKERRQTKKDKNDLNM